MQRPYLVVGDIGGTRSSFELFEKRDARLHAVHERSYRSGAFADFNTLLADFLAQEPVRVAAGGIDAVCFSVAGTGLGVCMLSWQNDAYAVHASEGGHTDAALYALLSAGGVSATYCGAIRCTS